MWIKKTMNSEELLKRKKIIFVLGGPGSGKGTQCEHIIKEFGFAHLSAGALLRREVDRGTKESALIDKIMMDGHIVPAEITVRLLKEEVLSNEKNIFIIDGFPRGFDQRDEFLKQIHECEFMLYLSCSLEEMTKRIKKRSETSNRPDDNDESLARRFATETNKVLPIVNLYRDLGKVVEIFAEGTPEEVYSRVREHFLQFA